MPMEDCLIGKTTSITEKGDFVAKGKIMFVDSRKGQGYQK